MTQPRINLQTGDYDTGPRINLQTGDYDTGPRINVQTGDYDTGPRINIQTGNHDTGPTINPDHQFNPTLLLNARLFSTFIESIINKEIYNK